MSCGPLKKRKSGLLCAIQRNDFDRTLTLVLHGSDAIRSFDLSGRVIPIIGRLVVEGCNIGWYGYDTAVQIGK